VEEFVAVKVLYMIDSLAHGGTERQLAELVRNLDRSRVLPHLCTLKESTETFDELDVPKLCLGYQSFTSPRLFYNLRDLDRFIRRHEIQLIQTFFQDPFLLAAMVRPFGRIPLIGSFRDLGFWRSASESFKMRIAYPFFAGFLANSQAVKEHFVQKDGIDPEKVEVIHNGFDCGALDALKPRTVSNYLTVGIVANLNRQVKRVDDFIRAAALVHARCPGVHFVIVGGGGLQGELTRLAAHLSIGGGVEFTGRVSAPLNYVQQFTVGAITSESEGFCNALIEYMACGIPVVATDVGGNREIVTEGVNGFLVPAGDPVSLADALMRLLEDEGLRLRIAENNRHKVAAEFSLKVMLQRQAGYYERMVGA
jgi:Glycosyltransferase